MVIVILEEELSDVYQQPSRGRAPPFETQLRQSSKLTEVVN